MYYVIQENLFREFKYSDLTNCLKQRGLEFETVKYRPFIEDLSALEFKTKRKDVWFFGSVNGARVVEKCGWNPGSLYNDSHDFEVYAPRYGENMLNTDGYVIEADDPLPEKLPFTFFARPTKDTKVFSGQLFTKDSWREYIEELKSKSSLGYITSVTKVLVAPIKDHITQEIRCWIVDGVPVTISQYKIGDRVNLLNMDHNQEAVIFSRNMAKIFSPAKAYVLDICLYQNEYKVVEVNCINCSGFYDGDMGKLIDSLEKAFS